MRKILNKSISIFVVLTLGIVFVGTHGFTVTAAAVTTTEPDLPVANEVNYEDATTAYATTARNFLSAYKLPQVARILLRNDIELSADIVKEVRTTKRTNSLQIDGQGHTLKTISHDRFNDGSTFYLDDLKGETATFHLKNLNVWTKGTNFIDGNGAKRSTGWDIILEDTTFDVNNDQDQARRIVRADMADLYLRRKVKLMSASENIIASSITIEPGADVYGVATYFDTSTWWVRYAKTKGTIDVGANATVKLAGNKVTYPVIYEHWHEINVHQGATLKGYKPNGRVFTFSHTAGVQDKYINVFADATLSAENDGGLSPLVEMQGGVKSHLYAAPGASLVLNSKPSSDLIPVIGMPVAGSTLELDSPALVDIRNNRPNGRIINLGKGVNATLTDVNARAWNKSKQQNLDGVPEHTWFNVNLVSDFSGRAVETESEQLKSEWNLNDYARLVLWTGDAPTIE